MRGFFCWSIGIAVAFALGAGIGAHAGPSTQVVADEAAGVVRVMVKGKEVAHFDEQGFHVDGDVTYAGAIKDVGLADQGAKGGAP